MPLSFRRIMASNTILIVITVLFNTTITTASPCTDLSELNVDRDVTISQAIAVERGTFTPSETSATFDVPNICRVVAINEPAIIFEVWLPVDGWNGKFHMSGNGGMAGVINYAGMAAAVNLGYAAASTDTGHVRPTSGSFDASWAIGRPDLVSDFGHRALHKATQHGQRITEEFYREPPQFSYYVGCSKGGQQGLMEAQRYPDDFDGIVAGNPANNWTSFYAGAHLWYALATLRDRDSYIPREKLPLLASAVNSACDAIDGLKDGVIDDPRLCDFDPSELICLNSDDSDNCLTPKQAQAVKSIWEGSRNSAGELIFPGLVPGGENGPGGGWGTWVTGQERFTSLHWLAAEGFFKYMVFEDPDWNFRTFDFDTDLAFALKKVGPALDATNPDLRNLQDSAGKLIVYHGWSDPDISPLGSINYYEDVLSLFGSNTHRESALAKTQDFFRLFLVPGMGHCSGGPGYNSLDALGAIERWVEDGIAPDSILGTRVEDRKVRRARPVCAYPSIAEWDGAGNPDDASSFTCVRKN